MTTYGAAPRVAPSAAPSSACTAPRRRTALVCASVLATVSLLLLGMYSGASHPRAHALARATADVRSDNGELALVPHAQLLRVVGAPHHSIHHHHDNDHAHHDHHHDDHHHNHHHHGHHHGGAESFFSWPLGHPASPHSFNYACHMPPLRTCMDGCGARAREAEEVATEEAATEPRWRCLMHCALSNCFVIGDGCAKAQFDECAATCDERAQLVPCAKTCFDSLCPAQQ